MPPASSRVGRGGATRGPCAGAREHVEARLAAALDAGGRIVDDSEAPEQWTLADGAGRVCICAWPDGATMPRTP